MSLQEKNVLEDENSLLFMFKDLAKDKERKQNNRAMQLQ